MQPEPKFSSFPAERFRSRIWRGTRAMRLRKSFLPWVACAVAAAAAVPSLAAGEKKAANGSIVASDFQFTDPSDGDTEVDILAGQTVEFSYPAGDSVHNVVFNPGRQPTSCVQTVATGGLPVLPAPPLPITTEPPGWDGNC